MRHSSRASLLALLCASLFTSSVGVASAGESTMPPQYQETVHPQLAARYTYMEDGKYSDALKMPIYSWMPADGQPKVIMLGIHGLTLHARRMRVLARALAVNGIGFIGPDMRGFGRCRFDEQKRFSTPDDDKTKVNHEKSYEDIVKLAQMIKADYPDLGIIALGESLGCTFCVRLAGEHPDLVTGLILSAPAIKVNPDMYAGKGQVKQGIKAVLSPHHELNMSGFFAQLASQRTQVQNEMRDDPMVLQKLPLGSLISTDLFVEKTAQWGKTSDKNLPVLILQGSHDGCVSPKHVTDLMNNMPSDDQSLAWRGNFGHLQLETIYMRAAVIDAIGSWLLNHSSETKVKMQGLEKNIADLGGTVSQ